MIQASLQPRPITVLIADDDVYTRFMLRRVLDTDGYEVLEVENGSQAIELCERLHPDIVLMDAMMPVMDGFETCAYLQTLPNAARTSVLMVTGLDDPDSVDRAFKAGAVDFITKPLQLSVLRHRINRLIQIRQADTVLQEAQVELERHVEERTAELAQTNTRLQMEVTAREQAEFQQTLLIAGLRAVVAVADELIVLPDVDALCKQAVELARVRFGLERCAIFLDREDLLWGTYGTDHAGRTTDERNQTLRKTPAWLERFRLLALQEAHWIQANEPLMEWNGEKATEIGQGWIAITLIQSASKTIGFFINDTALTHAPMDPAKQEIVAIYCSLLGNIIERKQAEQSLREARDELERRVQERTAELVQANDSLKEERNLLRTVIDSLPDNIFTKDLDGRFLICNAAQTLTAGAAAPADLTGKTVHDFYPAEIAAQYEMDDRSVIQTGQAIFDVERPLVTARGQAQWVLTTKVPLRDRHGTIIGLVGVSRNITERKELERELDQYRRHLEQLVDQRTTELRTAHEALQAEFLERLKAQNALQDSEQQLRRITDNMLDIICQVDPVGIIEYASPSCLDIFGCPADTLIGQSIYAGVHPDDVDHVQNAVQSIGRLEYRYRHADGHYIWLETLCNLLFEEQQPAPTGIILATRDITERKRAEHELIELDRLKTEFLSTAAHELRTPLTSIRGFTEILTTREFDLERRTRYLTMINEQANQLGQIIDDLLDVSRLEAKRNLTFNLKPGNICELVQKTAKLFIEGETNHTFQLEGMDNCPSCSFDSFRLGQVAKNLLSNAVKYSPEGGVIRIRGHVIPGYIEISVSDEGIGMTPEQQAHLFEKFYRADASNTAINGTGLGLSICKQIIEFHGGRIWVESIYGSGSTIYFTLPLGDQP